MGAPTIVCVEVERPSGRLRKWEDTLSAHVGQVDPALREQEAVSCLPIDERSFKGRIEYGALGEMFLCKFAATNYQFTRSLTTPAPTMPTPMMLVSVSRGSCKFFQCGHTCILTEGDWTLIDTKQPLGYMITSPEIEAFVMMLPRPSDAAIAALCERGVARQSNGRWGLSRVLHAMVNESFGEMRRLSPFRRKKTGCGHYHDGMGRLARADRDAAGDRTPTTNYRCGSRPISRRISPIPSSPSSESRTHAAFPFVGCTAISPRIRPDPYRTIFGSVGSSAARRRFETRARRIAR